MDNLLKIWTEMNPTDGMKLLFRLMHRKYIRKINTKEKIISQMMNLTIHSEQFALKLAERGI